MKKLFLLLCVTLMSLMASAQVTWNVMGGAGYGNSDFCAKAGFGMEVHFSNTWSVMPSLEVAYRNYDADNFHYSFEEVNKELYMQIPVLAAYRFRLSDAMYMKLKAGPYFAYRVTESYDFEDVNLKNYDVGLNAGIDFEVRHFVFGVEAECGFVDPLKDVREGAGNYEFSKNLAFYATIGWRF